MENLEYIAETVLEITPNSWTGAVIAGLLGTFLATILVWLFRRGKVYVPGTDEYESFKLAQALKDANATQNNEVVFSASFNNTDLKLFSGDIIHSSAQIIVSSDDTLLSAAGGVAEKIVNAAGKNIRKRLHEISKTSVPRGSIAITSGGLTSFRYILHAVVLTKTRDYTEFPSKSEIVRLVRHIVEVSDAVGAESLAMPVLASGTASKKLKEEGLSKDQDVIAFILHALAENLRLKRTGLKTIFLIVYDKNQLSHDFISSLGPRLTLPPANPILTV